MMNYCSSCVSTIYKENTRTYRIPGAAVSAVGSNNALTWLSSFLIAVIHFATRSCSRTSSREPAQAYRETKRTFHLFHSFILELGDILCLTCKKKPISIRTLCTDQLPCRNNLGEEAVT